MWWHLDVSDGGRGNETILHMLCIVDSLLNVLVVGLEIVNLLFCVREWGDGFVGHGEASFKEERKGRGSLGVFGGVVKTRALGAKGDAKGSTMFGIGGGIMRARVVSIVAWCSCGEASLEEIEDTLEQPLALLEFQRLSSFDGWKLVEIDHEVKSVVFNGITTWDETRHHELLMDPREEEDSDWDEGHYFFGEMR
ncbi:hypothetical protein Tco_0822632 [Tanacetum coccineum]|uniref:Uncharacterized protein n=1 Tax=Tanacetum coccineum TaxID=301880 RepID=A0ABQ5AGL0_9ASTR